MARTKKAEKAAAAKAAVKNEAVEAQKIGVVQADKEHPQEGPSASCGGCPSCRKQSDLVGPEVADEIVDMLSEADIDTALKADADPLGLDDLDPPIAAEELDAAFRAAEAETKRMRAQPDEVENLSKLWQSDPDVSDAFDQANLADPKYAYTPGLADAAEVAGVRGGARARDRALRIKAEQQQTARRVAARKAMAEQDAEAVKAVTGNWTGAGDVMHALGAMSKVVDAKMRVLEDEGSYFVPQFAKKRSLFAWSEVEKVKEALLKGLANILRPIPNVAAEVVDNDDVLLVVTGPRFFIDPLLEQPGCPLQRFSGLVEFVNRKPRTAPDGIVSSIDNYRAKVAEADFARSCQDKDWDGKMPGAFHEG